ncbi:MAG: hypothetical protein GYA55_00565, partial [SAR324 cluster bacterium]|nr:hypothetical protein [SAR324 cluster bacterium]
MPTNRNSHKRVPLISEQIHNNEAIEWWFVQGFFEGQSLPRCYFMTSMFRYHIFQKAKNPKTAHSLLVSVLDTRCQKHTVLSQIDRNMIKCLKSVNDDFWKGDLDPLLVNTFIEELSAHGPIEPIRIENSAIRLKEDPFTISWEAFSLSQDKKCFHLSFNDPGSSRSCKLHLEPKTPRIYVPKEGSRLSDAMAYASYPSLSLNGTVANNKVKGQAWLDHQWGNYGGWFINRSKNGKLRGWDWFCINLENGSEIAVGIHRDMQTRKVVGSFGFARINGKTTYDLTKISLKPLRYWRSSKTHIKYPVSWRLRINDIDADMLIEVLVDNQEISIFGPARAIWEGAGRISGKIRKKNVHGRARIELFGYGYIFDFKDYSKHFISQFHKSLSGFFPCKLTQRELNNYVGAPTWKYDPKIHTKTLTTPIWDLIKRGGKRWRSLYSLLLLEALGVPYESYLSLIAVIPELAHTGSLIIDDIEDNSTKRRGDICIHLRYGLDIALNAANTVYYLPYLILAKHPLLSKNQKLKLHEIMVKYAVRAHFGQGLDLYWSKNMSPSNLKEWLTGPTTAKILQMYAFKTSSVIEESAEFACVISKAKPKITEACIKFSR